MSDINELVRELSSKGKEIRMKEVENSDLFPRAESRLRQVILDRARAGIDRTRVQFICDRGESLSCADQETMWNIIVDRTGMSVTSPTRHDAGVHVQLKGDKEVQTNQSPMREWVLSPRYAPTPW
jgi:hypothetical protein